MSLSIVQLVVCYVYLPVFVYYMRVCEHACVCRFAGVYVISVDELIRYVVAEFCHENMCNFVQFFWRFAKLYIFGKNRTY